MCLRARSRSVFTSVKNGFDFAFFLATGVTPEGRDSAPVFIHRHAGFSESIRTWLRQILSQATVSNSPTLGGSSSPPMPYPAPPSKGRAWEGWPRAPARSRNGARRASTQGLSRRQASDSDYSPDPPHFRPSRPSNKGYGFEPHW